MLNCIVFIIKQKNNLMLMIKTFTSTNRVNYLHQQPEPYDSELPEDSVSSFYDYLKPELNKLIRNPSDETIERILAYAAKK
jgi:hypothetical protein